MTKEYLNRAEAAHYLTAIGLPLAKNTLQKMATTGGGPSYQIFGRYALYRRDELERWAREKLGPLRESTSASQTNPQNETCGA